MDMKIGMRVIMTACRRGRAEQNDEPFEVFVILIILFFVSSSSLILILAATFRSKSMIGW